MSFLSFLGVVFLGILLIFAWSALRSAFSHPTSNELRLGVRWRNELAKVLGAIGTLILLVGMAGNLQPLIFAGAVPFCLMVLLTWCADRRESKADRLEREQAGQ